ncbi:MMPL family transporter [Nocardia sp. 2]|uniref:MMPL family transporter n=1 Tax=Nocardia acididurans TaxID=2802282 RepID=A0ABS1M2J5_9NOCA|nr:efflux RND transporter permease subunit [Nocardia acididurans]MBL1074049.1 MMPL family transporter [Nocardia acididurans]
MIGRLTAFAVRAPKLVLVLVGVAFLLCGALGSQVAGKLSNGGFVGTDSESARVAEILERDYGMSGMQLLLTVESSSSAKTAAAVAEGGSIAQRLKADARVSQAVSPWTEPVLSGSLVSRDGKVGLIVATVRGDENTAPKAARELADEFTGTRDGVTVRAGGQAAVWTDTAAQSQKDLGIAEAIALPITFLLLVWFLRSLVAALIPVITGVAAIVGTTAVLYLLTFVTELSIFALNLTTAIGLALAIDYSLLIIGRYREEIAAGQERDAALRVAMRRGGRAVAFSGLTVGIALIGLTFFPMAFLRSLGFAGLAVVVLSILLTLTLVPALLMLLGERLTRKPLREAKPVRDGILYRTTRAVQRRPALCALPVVALLLALGAPILGLKMGLPDDRVLPTSLESRQVGDLLRDRFDDNASGTVHVIVEAEGADVTAYATALSLVPDVQSVTGPAGSYAQGHPAGLADPKANGPSTVHLTIATRLNPYSDAGRTQLEALRAVHAPAPVLFGGQAQQTSDASSGIAQGFPKALAWIVVTTFVLLLLLTSSVILPLKAILLNVVSLSATFGALVWIFQDGNLSGLGTTATGFTIATMPVLLFCVSFGLSMDYEVFLLSRFTEEWQRSDKSRRANDDAVALGIARSGPIVTAAAVLMAVVFAGIAVSGVTMNRMLGLGLALAVLIDATLVRMILVPAFMRALGTANWWSPTASRRILEKAALRE